MNTHFFLMFELFYIKNGFILCYLKKIKYHFIKYVLTIALQFLHFLCLILSRVPRAFIHAVFQLSSNVQDAPRK